MIKRPDKIETFYYGPDLTEEEYEFLEKQIANNLSNEKSLAELPADCIIAILEYCDFRTLIFVSKTCQRLHDISNDGKTKYHFIVFFQTAKQIFLCLFRFTLAKPFREGFQRDPCSSRNAEAVAGYL